MEGKQEATPQWEAKRYEQAGNGEWLWCVYDDSGMLVAKRLTQTRAELIVNRMNAHDQLVEALSQQIAITKRLMLEAGADEQAISDSTYGANAALSRAGA